MLYIYIYKSIYKWAGHFLSRISHKICCGFSASFFCNSLRRLNGSVSAMFFALNAVMASVSSSSRSGSEGGVASHGGDSARPEFVVTTSVGLGGIMICYTMDKSKVYFLCNDRFMDESPLQIEESWADPEDSKLPSKSYDKKNNSAGDTVQVPAFLDLLQYLPSSGYFGWMQFIFWFAIWKGPLA